MEFSNTKSSSNNVSLMNILSNPSWQTFHISQYINDIKNLNLDHITLQQSQYLLFSLLYMTNEHIQSELSSIINILKAKVGDWVYFISNLKDEKPYKMDDKLIMLKKKKKKKKDQHFYITKDINLFSSLSKIKHDSLKKIIII